MSSNAICGIRRRSRTILSVESLEVRVLLTYGDVGVTEFAMLGDYGREDIAPVLARVINIESDSNLDFSQIDSFQAPYHPSPSQQQDFVVGVGDARYFTGTSGPTYAGVHGPFCNYLAGVQATPCTSAFGLPTGTDDNSTTHHSGVNRFFSAAGNHEYDEIEGANGDIVSSIADYTDYFDLPGNGVAGTNTSGGSELFYDVVQGHVHLFVLDSEAMLEDANTIAPAFSAQARWLEMGLKNSTARWQVVSMHHSPYTSDDRFEASLRFDFAAWGADLVVSGHSHIYERIEPQSGQHNHGTTFVVNGTGVSDGMVVTPRTDSQVHIDDGSMGVVFFEATDTRLSGVFKTIGVDLITSVTRDTFRVDGLSVAVSLPCDHVGSVGCDIDDLDWLYESMNLIGTDGQERPVLIDQWLGAASSSANPAKADASDIYVRGDLNLDGTVDALDLGLMLNNFGGSQEPGWVDGDLDGDGDVDSNDLGWILNNYR